ncbi:MAG: hypothetical protein HDS93_05070 [Bacteroidales bacterium]|nr:hypothetical protein [Bacteroidales bacterium]MBD5209457.1 hypothetical protein [Bacteroidales bacterium]
MGKKLKKAGFWIRRRSRLPVLVAGSFVVLLLLFNEETSLRQNIEYEKEIGRLESEIKLNLDSAEYYRSHREAIELGRSDLEHLAREQFKMKRPGEDIYILEGE